MSPAAHNISIFGGDDYVLPVTFTTGGTSPSAIDVSTRTYTAQVRAWPSGGVLATFDVNMTNAATGIVSISLGHAVTATLAGAVAEARWDMQQSNAGTITTVLKGTVTVSQDVTR
jgi:hypothetical protein